jgi:hypothetical protein
VIAASAWIARTEQYYAKPLGSNSGARDKQPDPNSPFAKLAALKQQLEQVAKSHLEHRVKELERQRIDKWLHARMVRTRTDAALTTASFVRLNGKHMTACQPSGANWRPW